MIKVLDSFVADKIAAGEVIERPVSAVKELVENSIDAGAGAIIVELKNGGKSYIRVTDDGCGIQAEEAETAFLRHATSKISGITDLDNITSLGFRGEALASISAVSRLTMVSRTSGSDTGIKLVMHGGKTVSVESIGANKGTTMIVEDLFYNTPARRKFMKSDAREASAVIELIQHFAVCYSSIRFMMISNGKTQFTTTGDGDTLSVIKSLYPEFAAASLLSLTSEEIRGFVSDPGNTLTTKKGELFFVNGRLVSSNVIEKALEEGYRGRIFSGYPVAILFIESDPHDIDVNIHPGKREIRFLKQDEIRQAVSDAVSEVVMTDRGVPAAVKPQSTAIVLEDAAMTEDKITLDAYPVQPDITDYLSSLERPAVSNKTAYYEKAIEAKETNEVSENITADVYRPFDFGDLSLKGYVFDTYIIMQGRDSLYIFDQHAAHERVFYEKFMKGYKNLTHVPQPILTPFTLNVSSDVYCMERDWLDQLKNIGYDIEDFGERTFIIRGIPPYMDLDEASGFVRGFTESVDEAGNENRIVIDKLIMKSCKSAVKANDRLSEHEISELMSRLAECDNPYSCPHGRPTFIKMTAYDIERSFRRK